MQYDNKPANLVIPFSSLQFNILLIILDWDEGREPRGVMDTKMDRY